MLNITDLKISRKLMLGFSAVIAVIGATGATALVNINTMNDARAESTQANATMQAIFDAQFRLARQENSVRGWIISEDDYYLGRVESHRAKFKEALNNIRALAEGEADQLQRVDEVERAADLWFDGVVPLATAAVPNPATRGQAVALVGNDGPADQLIAPAEEGIDALLAAEQEELTQLNAASEAAAQTTGIVMLGGLLLSALLSAAIGMMLTRMIARPVNQMTDAMRRLADGDKTIDVPAIGRKDEVGEMAGAVQVFKDAAIALDKAAAEKVRLEAAAAEERKRNDAIRAATEKEQTEVVDALAGALERIAQGDLTCQVNSEFPGRYLKLRGDFNAAVRQLHEAMVLVSKAPVTPTAPFPTPALKPRAPARLLMRRCAR